MTITITELCIIILTVVFSIVGFQLFLLLRKLITTLENVNEKLDIAMPALLNLAAISDKINSGLDGFLKTVGIVSSLSRKISHYSLLFVNIILKPLGKIFSSRTGKKAVEFYKNE